MDMWIDGGDMISGSWKRFLVLVAIMLLAWAPYLIAFAPGTMGYDTFAQIRSFYPDHDMVQSIQSVKASSVPGRFSDHHPLFDTLVFGSFAYVSDLLFGGWFQGLTLYICLQSIAMACTLVLVCAYMRRVGVAPAFVKGSYAFYCLLPIFPINAFTIIKDTLFIWPFVLYALLTVEVVRTRGRVLHRRRWAVAFVVLSVVLALTKKTGIYIVCAESLFLAIVFRDCWKQALGGAAVTAAVMWLVLPSVVFPLLRVVPGGRQEALGTAFQQTALYVLEHGDEVTEDERRAIDAVIDYEAIPDRYVPDFVDPIKYSYRWDTATTEDLIAYARTWFKQGIRHPVTYARATWGVLKPFFDPSTRFNLYLNTELRYGELDLRQYPMVFEPMREGIASCFHTLCDVPVLGLLLSNVLYCLAIPVFCFSVVAVRPDRRWQLPCCFLVLLAIGSFLIAPIGWTRYAFPLIYLAPVMLGMALFCSEGKHSRGKCAPRGWYRPGPGTFSGDEVPWHGEGERVGHHGDPGSWAGPPSVRVLAWRPCSGYHVVESGMAARSM